MSEEEVIDIDALLDGELDDLEDLPSFKPFPPGAHKVRVSFELKKVNEEQAVEILLKYDSCEELVDPTEDIVPAVNDEASVLCQLSNKFGQGTFKKFAAIFGEKLGIANNRQIIEAVKDIECIVLTSTRPDKKDPDRKYLDIKELEVL